MRASIEIGRNYGYVELTINRLCSQRGKLGGRGFSNRRKIEERRGKEKECGVLWGDDKFLANKERERKELFLNSNNREIAVIASDIRGLAQKEGKFNERMGIFMMIKRFAIAKKLHG